jgi:hypothetical protein
MRGGSEYSDWIWYVKIRVAIGSGRVYDVRLCILTVLLAAWSMLVGFRRQGLIWTFIGFLG